jgi:hypothetical protein
VLEQANGKLNLQALTDQLNKGGGGGGSSGGGTAGGNSQATKVIIDDLKVTDASVVIKPGLPGLDTEVTVPVASLELKNIGNGDGNQNGAAVGDVILAVMAGLATSAGNSPLIPPELKSLLKLDVGQFAQQLGGDLQKQLGNFGDFGKGLGQLGGDLGKDITKGKLPDAGKDIGKDLGNAVGGLFGQNKDKKNGQ